MASKQRRATAEFLDSEAERVIAVANQSVQEAAAGLRKKTLDEIRRNFKAGNSSAGFFGAVKQYDLPPEPGRGPVSYVRVGVSFMRAFQEAQTISGEPNLIILLPDGVRLRFPRINKSNSWKNIYNRYGKNFFITKVSDGAVVVYQNPKDGRNYPVYKFQKSVQAPKKLHFYETADQFGDRVRGG